MWVSTSKVQCGRRAARNVHNHWYIASSGFFFLLTYIFFFFPISPKHVSSSIISSCILKFQPHFPSMIGGKKKIFMWNHRICGGNCPGSEQMCFKVLMQKRRGLSCNMRAESWSQHIPADNKLRCQKSVKSQSMLFRETLKWVAAEAPFYKFCAEKRSLSWQRCVGSAADLKSGPVQFGIRNVHFSSYLQHYLLGMQRYIYRCIDSMIKQSNVIDAKWKYTRCIPSFLRCACLKKKKKKKKKTFLSKHSKPVPDRWWQAAKNKTMRIICFSVRKKKTNCSVEIFWTRTDQQTERLLTQRAARVKEKFASC